MKNWTTAELKEHANKCDKLFPKRKKPTLGIDPLAIGCLDDLPNDKLAWFLFSNLVVAQLEKFATKNHMEYYADYAGSGSIYIKINDRSIRISNHLSDGHAKEFNISPDSDGNLEDTLNYVISNIK